MDGGNGRHNPAVIFTDAQVFRNDLPNAKIHLLDAGHKKIAAHILGIRRSIAASQNR